MTFSSTRRQQETCVAHIQSEDDECVVAAIKLAGRISHNVELCRDLSGASIKTLIAAVMQLAGKSDSKPVKTIVLWYICMQQFSQSQAAKVVPAMLLGVCEATFADAASSAVQAEGIRAIDKLLVCCGPVCESCYLELPKKISLNLAIRQSAPTCMLVLTLAVDSL